MIRRLLTIFLLLASAGASVTVRAKLTDGTGTVSRTAFLRFQLQNCGPNTPADPTLGVATIQTQFDLRPNQPDGSILYGNLISNDDILCGGVASTYYVITPMKDQLHPLRDGLPFVLHNGDTFDPSVTQPMVTFPPAPPQSPLCCGAANTPPPPTPPTTCGILPGTTNEIVKYINGPCGRLGDSSGTDDGTHPTRWPNGITVGNGGYYRELANNASPGTGLNLLVERDSSGAAQLASLSSQKVIGIAGYGAGTVGSVQVLLIGYSPLVCDGQTVLGDYFIASPTVPGECNDVGTSLIPGVLGVITSINSGADSLGRVEYFPSNGTSSGASGTVGPCNSLNIPGPIGYFTAIQKVDCDDSFTTDGAGNAALQSAAFYGLFDGFTYYTPLAGPPPFLAASSVYVVPPPAIAATYGLQLPVEGSGCLEGTDGINANGDPSVSLAFTGLPCTTNWGDITTPSAANILTFGAGKVVEITNTAGTVTEEWVDRAAAGFSGIGWLAQVFDNTFTKGVTLAAFEDSATCNGITYDGGSFEISGPLGGNPIFCTGIASGRKATTFADGTEWADTFTLFGTNYSGEYQNSYTMSDQNGRGGFAIYGPSGGGNGFLTIGADNAAVTNGGQAQFVEASTVKFAHTFANGFASLCDILACTHGVWVDGSTGATYNDVTPAVDDNSKLTANTAYVIGQAASATPLVDADSAVVGTSTRYARADHVHPLTFHCLSVTPVTVNTSTTNDQNLMACTVPAGTLNAALKSLRVHGAAVYSTAAGSTATINLKVKLCTVSGCASGTVVNLINITSTALGTITVANDPLNFDLLSTTQTTGGSAAFEAHGNFNIDLTNVTSSGLTVFADQNTATVGTIDSSLQLFLQVTGAFSAASGSNAITMRQLVVDSVN